MNFTRNRCGFTLLEMSVVLVIIAVVVGMSINSGISVIATARQTATTQKINAINAALAAYGNANSRFPCPADLTIAQGNIYFGLEAANPGICTGGTPAANHAAAGITNTLATAAEGAVPVVTIGLANDFMVDGWGNRFRYAVDVSMTSANAFATTPTGCNKGAITISDSNGNARSTGAIYALISHGANGHGAYTSNGAVVNSGSVNTNELKNCHCNSSGNFTSYPSPLYVQMAPSVDTANALDGFDDIVDYKERWQLQTPWDRTGPCLYVAATDPGNKRINVYSLTSGSYAMALGSSGTGTGQFSIPYDVAIDAMGNFWGVDGNPGNRVEEFNTYGTSVGGIGNGYNGVVGSGYVNGLFFNPTGVAVDASYNVWVADYGNNRMQKFTSSGTWLLTIPGSCPNTGVPACLASAANGQFYAPTNVTIDSMGNVWVTDYGNTRAQEFNSSGTWLLTLPQAGTAGCQTSSVPACPEGNYSTNPYTYAFKIGFDSGGNIWTGQSSGTLVESSATSGALINSFSGYNLNDLALDYNNNIWSGWAATGHIQKINSVGILVGTYGSTGTGNGQFGATSTPISIAVSPAMR